MGVHVEILKRVYLDFRLNVYYYTTHMKNSDV